MGHHVLLSPEWIQDVRWLDSVVTVDLDRQAIKEAPAYNAHEPLAREAEATMYSHYGRHGYWRDPVARAVA
jgi:hypothetical protein